MKPVTQSRLRAASTHLLISIVVALLCAYFIFIVWYPNALVKILGGIELFCIVLACDLLIGPLLTLIIFNTKKSIKNLVLDCSLIAILQIGVLVYGLHAVIVSRPVYVVFVKDQLEIVTSVELDAADIALANDDRYRHLPWFGIKYVSIKVPANKSERGDVLFLSVFGGKDYAQLPKYYQEYNVDLDNIKKQIKNIDTLRAKNEADKVALDLVISQLKQKSFDVSLGWLYVKYRFGFCVAIMDKKTGLVLEYLPFDLDEIVVQSLGFDGYAADPMFKINNILDDSFPLVPYGRFLFLSDIMDASIKKN